MADTCKNCGAALIKKETQKKPSQLSQPYYYTAYLFCPVCRKLYHSDRFKVVNHSPAPNALPLYQDAKVEYDVEIWTDGACIFNGQKNARAAWAFVSNETERAGKVPGKQTNNVAEALAIYHALVWAGEKGHKKIKIYSDSQISINNMRKNPVTIKQNTEIFMQIAGVMSSLGLTVHFEKVLGHSGDINNERADSLANKTASSG
jgi:ribonuclease HI